MDYHNTMALSELERSKMLRLATAINEKNRRLRAEYTQKLAARLSAAKEELRDLVAAFKKADPELRRVILFGSMARQDVKRLEFDIDLAVDSERYNDLLGIAMDSEFKVDLIDLASASPYIVESVKRDGVEIYHAE